MCAQHKQATKAAQLRFYETLRSELGSEVGVTILTAGFVESEMTKGKVIQKDGQVAIDLEARDVSCKKKKKKKKKKYVSQGNEYIYKSFACRCRSGCSQWPVWRSCAR
jgi:short-subunit dehydrogenase